MKVIAVIMGLMLAGCLQSTVYVCPDGSTSDTPKSCPPPKSTKMAAPSKVEPECLEFTDSSGEPDTALIRRCGLHKSPNREYCRDMPVLDGSFDRSKCLIEAAALTNDTGPCEELDGNVRLMCEAAAAKDREKCASIPQEELQQECRSLLSSLRPDLNRPSACTEMTGEELVWCLVYASGNPQECLRIDDVKYPDEAAFCRANSLKNASLCDRVSDRVMGGLCRKTVLGL